MYQLRSQFTPVEWDGGMTSIGVLRGTGQVRSDCAIEDVPVLMENNRGLTDPASDTLAGVAFGRFRVLPRRRELLADGQPIKLGGRAIDVLMALIDARGAVVSKDALMTRVWPGRFVEENNLQAQISALRAAFGAERELIRSVPGRGYQFTGEIRILLSSPEDLVSVLTDASQPAPVLPLTNLQGPVSEVIGRDDELVPLKPLSKAPASVAFGRFRVLPHRRELLADGQPIELGGRAFDLLLALIDARGTVVSKDALTARIWSGRIVGESNLTVQITALRAALGADRELIRTVSGRGYQFTGDIHIPSESPGERTPGVAAAQPEGFPPLTNLPAMAPELFGRKQELRQIGNLASSRRLVTLTGAGGIGKTCLALGVARQLLPQFADGVWLVELAPLSDAGFVPGAVAGAVGLEHQPISRG